MPQSNPMGDKSQEKINVLPPKNIILDIVLGM
jgi:hypothetical protein